MRRALRPTPLSMALIRALESVDLALLTPKTRRRTEELMARIERGELSCARALDIALPLYKGLFEKCEARAREIAAELATAVKSTSEAAERRRAKHRRRRSRRRRGSRDSLAERS